MMREKFVLLLCVSVSVFLTACNPEDWDSSAPFLGEQESPSLTHQDKLTRVYLKEATLEDIENYTVEREDHLQVVICHVLLDEDQGEQNQMVAYELLMDQLEFPRRDKADIGSTSSETLSIESDYLGACRPLGEEDGLIVLDDPILEDDGYVCVDLTGEALYECLEEHNQNIHIEL